MSKGPKLLGQISFNKADHVMADPVKERARQTLMRSWRRDQIAAIARSHLKRIAHPDGIGQSVRQLFDIHGLPPANVSLGAMIRVYRTLKKQEGWLSAIQAELEARLRVLDPVRFRRDEASRRGALRDRREQRMKEVETRAAAEGTAIAALPPRLRGALTEAIELIALRADQNAVRRRFSFERYDMLASRQIQVFMRYLFFDELPPGAADVPEDPESQYEHLDAALAEVIALSGQIRQSLGELQEFITSADRVAMGEE